MRRIAWPHRLCPVLIVCLPVACTPDPDRVPAQPTVTTDGSIRFEDATESSGVMFRHVAGRSAQKWMPEIMGSGVAIADFNRDGAPDIVLINSGQLWREARPAGAANALYLNDGQGHFREVSVEWGLPSPGYGMGVAVGDYDNDGYVDLLLTQFDGNDRLLRNTGTSLIDVTEQVGLSSDGAWSTSAGFLDFDADGWLDLYVARYLHLPSADAPQSFRNQVLVYPTPLLFPPIADRVWRNDGQGHFTDHSEASGVAAAPSKGLAVAIGDVNVDGRPDVYVANDTAANQLWLTAPEGSWEEVAALAGSAYDEHGREEGSMGADFSDFDGNGLPDIAVSNFHLEVTSIYRQSQPLLFDEAADRVGVGQTSRARLSFGLDYFDADNDGWEELLVANGHIEDNIELNSSSVTFAQPNSLYRNLGDGHYADISEQAGEALLGSAVSRGLATGDLNGDGRLDFVISNNDGPAQVAFNASEAGHFVLLWLEGRPSNRSAIGARVVAQIGDRQLQREVMGAQSYLSVSDFRLHLGLGQAEQVDSLQIHWPSGLLQTLGPLAQGRHYRIVEGQAPEIYVPGERVIAP